MSARAQARRRDSAATVAALGRAIQFDRAVLILHDPIKDVFTVLGVAGPVHDERH